MSYSKAQPHILSALIAFQAEQKRTTLQLAMKDQKLAQMRNVVRELEGKLADALKRGTDV